ncbi:putative flavonol 3-O-glucosyltransferase [Helianthus annuus]|nr:putative flavonol 3-O-glucosyltransferase [Helianthus annuus]
MENTVAELVFIPAPAVGHIMSTVEMAKVLVKCDQRLLVTVLLMNPLSPSWLSPPTSNHWLKTLENAYDLFKSLNSKHHQSSTPKPRLLPSLNSSTVIANPLEIY